MSNSSAKTRKLKEAEAEQKRQRVRRNTIIGVTVLAVIILIIALIIGISACNRNANKFSFKEHVYTVSTNPGGSTKTTTVLYDDVPLSLLIGDTDPNMVFRDLYGHAIAVVTKENRLYYIKGTKVTKVSDKVSKPVAISADGYTLMYIDDDDLHFYDGNKLQRSSGQVASGGRFPTAYTLSPNGGYGLYTTEGGELWLFPNGGARERVNNGGVEISGEAVSISNDGKYIYYIDASGNMCSISYNSAAQSRFSDYKQLSDFKVMKRTMNNIDNTQLIFASNDASGDHAGAYFSENGNTAVKLDGYNQTSYLSPVFAYTNSNVNFNFHAATSSATFMNGAFISRDNTISVLRTDYKLELVAAATPNSVRVTTDSSSIFYIAGGKFIKASMSNLSDKTTIADGVTDVAVSGNGKYVYYKVNDALYYYDNGTGKLVAEKIDSNTYNVTSSGVIFYQIKSSGENESSSVTVYSSKTGGTPKKHMTSSSVSYTVTISATIMITSGDVLYSGNGGDKLVSRTTLVDRFNVFTQN